MVIVVESRNTDSGETETEHQNRFVLFSSSENEQKVAAKLMKQLFEKAADKIITRLVKLLTIAIPCYNSAAYMDRCIRSLLPGGDEVEILIVDDGSEKDNTAEIANRYEREYPGICRAIHQENGGHGEAVNAGLRNAAYWIQYICVYSVEHLVVEM